MQLLLGLAGAVDKPTAGVAAAIAGSQRPRAVTTDKTLTRDTRLSPGALVVDRNTQTIHELYKTK